MIREQHRNATEHAAQAADPAAAAIQVHDVRVLVGQDQAQPVVGVADEAVAAGRRRGDFDRVARNGRRPSVRQVVLVDEDHVHARGRPAERGVQLVPNLLRDRRHPARERGLPLMKMNVEMPRRQRPEAEAPVVACRGVGLGRERQSGAGQHERRQHPTDDRHLSRM